LRDLNTCRSQFLVVNPRYDPAEAAKILTRARQLKKCTCRLLSKSLSVHIICIYILYACVSSTDFRLVVELEIYLRGIANDAWVPSLFRDDLDFGKRRCGRTNLNTGRIVGNPEVMELIASFEDYFRVARHQPRIGSDDPSRIKSNFPQLDFSPGMTCGLPAIHAQSLGMSTSKV
jgi:hypothetical protein